MAAALRTRTGATASTPAAFSRARSPPICGCGSRPQSSWCSTCARRRRSGSPCRPHCSPGQTRSSSELIRQRLDCLRQLLARVEHARLHRTRGQAGDRCDLFHRLAVVVDEIDDLPMLIGEPVQRGNQPLVAIFVLHHGLRIPARIADALGELVVELIVATPSQSRKSLVTGDGEEPRGYRRAALEGCGPSPHIEKDFAENVFSERLVANDANEPAIDRGLVAGKEVTHCRVIPGSDPRNENIVGGLMAGRLHRNRCTGHTRTGKSCWHGDPPTIVTSRQTMREGKEGSSGARSLFSGRAYWVHAA